MRKLSVYLLSHAHVLQQQVHPIFFLFFFWKTFLINSAGGDYIIRKQKMLYTFYTAIIWNLYFVITVIEFIKKKFEKDFWGDEGKQVISNKPGTKMMSLTNSGTKSMIISEY